MTADSSGCPIRLIELLIADASPAFDTGTDDVRVEVSGATTSEIPTPNSSTNGRMSTMVDSGGRYVDGSPSASVHGSVSAGTRESQVRPAAMSSGPATRKRRGP